MVDSRETAVAQSGSLAGFGLNKDKTTTLSIGHESLLRFSSDRDKSATTQSAGTIDGDLGVRTRTARWRALSRRTRVRSQSGNGSVGTVADHEG